MPSLTINEVLNFSPFLRTNIFVETGTFYGTTICNMIPHYKKIYSIELDEKYATNASQFFKNAHNVTILKGDSAIILPLLCKTLDEPAFFWLDGHWSGGDTAKGPKDCPLIEELQGICTNMKHRCVIAIDDVRLFGIRKNEDWTTITREAVKEVVKDRMISCKFFPSDLYQEDRMVIYLKSL